MVGPGELTLLLVVVLIFVLMWRGPKMLPRIGEAFGQTIKGIRENVPGIMNDDDDEEISETSDASESTDSGDKPGS